MGRLNELLGAAAHYSRGLAAQFGLQEQEGVPTVAPELVPTSDIHMRPEQWALHGGMLLWGRSDIAAGGAGFRSQVAIEPGVGEVVIVERVDVDLSTGVAVDYILGLSRVALTNSTGNLVARDARRIISAGGGAPSGTRIRTANGAALADLATQVAIINQASTAAAPRRMVQLDCVLVAPWSLRLLPAVDNAAISNVTWWVRTRPGTPRELATFGDVGAL